MASELVINVTSKETRIALIENGLLAELFIERESWAALEPGGELLLVANRFIRYEKMMEGLFRRVSVAGEDERYRVLAARK